MELLNKFPLWLILGLIFLERKQPRTITHEEIVEYVAICKRLLLQLHNDNRWVAVRIKKFLEAEIDAGHILMKGVSAIFIFPE